MRPHRRRILIAFIVSVVAHTALFTLTKLKPPDIVIAGSAPEVSMDVRLVDVEPTAPAASTAAPSERQTRRPSRNRGSAWSNLP